MIDLSLAHVDGIPIEETFALYAPILLLIATAASVTARVRCRRLRERGRIRRRPEPSTTDESGAPQHETNAV